MLIGMTTGLAAEGESTPTPNRHTVIVPYDGSKPVDGQAPERFYLDYETFQDLWTKAKSARVRDSKDEDPAALAAQDFAFSSSLHEVKIGKDKIEVRARYSLQTRGPAWQKIPFGFEGATAREITLDGSAAAVGDDQQLMIEKSGQHRIEVRYEIAVAENWLAAAWKAPRAAAAMLSITMPDDRTEPVVNDGIPLVVGEDAGKPVFVAALGNRDQISITRRASVLTSSKLERPRLAQIDSLLAVRKGVRQLDSKIDFEFPGAELQRFSIGLDSGFTPVNFSAPNLATWGLGEDENGARSLEFTLAEPAKDQLAVELTAEAPLQQLPGESAFPKVLADAVRAEHAMAIAVGAGVAVTPQPLGVHRRVGIPANRVTADAQTVAAFAAPAEAEALVFQVAAAPAERSARIEYAYQVSGAKLETVATLELTSETPILEAILDLPEGATVELVEGPEVADWLRDGQQLRLRFRPAAAKTIGVLIGLVQEFEDEQETLTLRPIGLTGFEKITGSAIVVAHAAKETVLRFDETRHVVREVEATTVNQTTEVLPPLVRKHGFKFEEGEFQATLELDDLTAQFDSNYVLFAQVFDTWVSLTWHLDIEVQRSAINAISFSLPEEMPEVRVVSDALREVRSVVADGRRTYTATFQRDVLDILDFVIQAEVPLEAAGTSLPDLDVLGARRLDRFLVLETQTNDELGTTLTGVEAVPKDYVPYLPETLLNAKYFQASPGWEFTVRTDKLQSTAGNDAVITECNLTTAIRANGEEWHRAVYKLLNRSLQFLPVKLDPEAELVAVRVSEQEVQADRGVIDGEEVALIPLIQTQPGELSYNVEIVYRRAAPSEQLLAGSFELALDDPWVIGQTVEQTFWSVFVPEGYTLRGFDGNMREMTETDRLSEKVEANLAEIRRLNKLAKSETASAEVKLRAYGNASSAADVNDEIIQSASNGDELFQILDADNGRLAEEARQGLGTVGQDVGRVIVYPGSTVTANGTIGGGINIGGGVQQTETDGQSMLGPIGGFIENAGRISSRNREVQQKSEAQIGNVKDQIRFNDNLSVGNDFVQLGHGGKDAPNQQPEKPAAKKGQAEQFDFSHAQIGHGGFEGKGEKPTAQPEGETPFENRRARQEIAQKPGHGQAALIDLGPQMQQQQGPAAAGQMGGQAFLAGGDIVFSAGSAGNINLVAGASAGRGSIQQLHPKGRVSLQVDFPTTGEARHFKKLKDHAQLTIAASKAVELKIGLAWVWFALALVILIGCDRLIWRLRRNPE